METHCFDKLYILNDALEIHYFTKEPLSTDPKEIIEIFDQFGLKNIVIENEHVLSEGYRADCNNACLCLAINSGAPSSVPGFPDNVKKIGIDEYSCGGKARISKGTSSDASMGFSYIRGNGDCFGIKFHDFNRRTIVEKAHRLFEFKDKHFLKLLLNHENPSKELAEQYFATTMLFPGYLQSRGSVTLFIATQVYKHLTADGILTNNCDFYLNSHFIDTYAVQKVLKSFNCSVYYITPNTKLETTPVTTKTPQIRIFCNFFLESDDYRALYTLTEAGAACSGDNSCSDVFSSENLPFAMQSCPPSSFITYFWLKFPSFLEQFKNAEECGTYHVEKLYHYFSLLCNQFWHNRRFSTLSPKDEEEFIKDSINLTIKFGTLLKDPELQAEWKTFRQMLATDYNYSKNYQNFILKGALYVAAEAYQAEILKKDAEQKLSQHHGIPKPIILSKTTPTSKSSVSLAVSANRCRYPLP